MELLILLIIGLGFGALGATIYVRQETKRRNRERWRKYAATRKARRGKGENNE
jgi:hypothetical protein